MTRSKAILASLIAILMLSLSSRGARAETVCVQPPVVVPGLSGPPVWFQPPGGGANSWRSTLEDPRWAGGPVRSFPFIGPGENSGIDQFDAQYRFVFQGTMLYVSIQALVDVNGPDGADAAYFGITEPAGSGAHLLELPLDTASAPSACSPTHDPACPIPTNPGLINYFKTLNRSPPGGILPTWTAQAAAPPWLSNVATWTSSGPTVAWAVTFQIDTTTFTGASQMFFGTRISSPGTVVELGSSKIYDPALSSTNPQIGDTIVGVLTSSWLNVSALGTACPLGISISPSSVGVWNGAALTNAVNTQCSPGPCTATNKFRVEAEGVPAGATPYSLRTRIRVADWGAQIADPNAPWTDFGIPTGVFLEPQSYFTGNAQWAWTPSTTVPTTVDLDYTCATDGVHTYCPYLPNAAAAGQQHQCMLFELGLSPGVQGTPGWSIQTPAVYRNMEFGTLSTLSVPATVSVKGLQKLTGVAAERDVYLYIETKNLPPPGVSPMELRIEDLTAAREYAMHPPLVPRPLQKRGRIVAPAQSTAEGPLSLPILTADQALEQVYPTYRVFAYYDSGRTTKIKGRLEKVLIPMAPFGFYLEHKGPFYGFGRKLEFLGGIEAREIAPNFYLIHLPNEGAFQLQTTLSAEEKPLAIPAPPAPAPLPPAPPPAPPPPSTVRCSCDVVQSAAWSPCALGLAGLGALALVTRGRRRRRRSSVASRDRR